MLGLLPSVVQVLGNAHSAYYFHGKRRWDGEEFIQLGFSGQLPLALDAAMLCITTADLAFNYADGVMSYVCFRI